MRIRNDMDIREQVDPKRCIICRTVGHNGSKCPHGNVYTGQSSRLATLILKMGLKQAKQLEAGHVHVKKIKDAMKENAQRARSTNAELYS
ncbi:hypothetical protein GOBAR_DD01364 [Gossypium barbadense]|nr:hypothetical protein GOBAR_DD01364 [Gossypium barbadense]